MTSTDAEMLERAQRKFVAPVKQLPVWAEYDATLMRFASPRVQEIRQKATKDGRRRSVQNMVQHRCDLRADNPIKNSNVHHPCVKNLIIF